MDGERRILSAACGAALVSMAAPAWAQDDGEPAGTTPGEDRATSFVAVEGAESESVPGGALLVGAYGTALVLLLAYVLWLGALQAGANREIARLGAVLDKKKDGPFREAADKK